MAWLGDSLSSLSHLKGQLTSFTKEVLSEGIVNEIDDRTKELKEANERCVKLQELLDTKDAEISLLHRQNCELQKIVVELNSKSKESNDNQEDEGEVFFWDPPSVKNRNSKNQNHARQLQEQLAQATVKIRELEAELKRTRKMNNGSIMDELPDGHQNAEFLRAKQDMVNRIVRIKEKNHEVERNVKQMQEDEIALVNDFYTVISKLDYQEKVKLIRDALKNLESDRDATGEDEKSDSDEKSGKTIANESVSLKSDFLQDILRSKMAESSRIIAELQLENKNLNYTVEELDRQHTETVEELLSLKEKLEKKHQCLQNAYEQLYVDYNESQSKVTKLYSELSSMKTNMSTHEGEAPLENIKEESKEELKEESKEELKEESKEELKEESKEESKEELKEESKEESKEELKEELREESKKESKEELKEQLTEEQRKEGDNSEIAKGEVEGSKTIIQPNEIEELERRVKEILKNSYIECIEPGESIFEAVAKRYVEASWKKDVLERKVTEITRNLKETTEMRDNLQLECDDMQAHIDSLLLNIQHLKLNLPSIPEASEERVASLEAETESLREEVRRLREENDILKKLQNNERKLENGEIHVEREETFADKENKINYDKEVAETRDEEDSVEDLKRRLLEFSNETNQLRTSLDKYKETIEELKLGKENLAHELKASAYSVEELERELKVTLDVKNELECENGDLIRENEDLRADLTRWLECNGDTRKNNLLLLEELCEKLDKVEVEKNDLEYDLLNMRKELDVALHETDVKGHAIAQLSQEKEKLAKENASLLEQLTATQDESQEKIELLTTEKVLLDEEYAELRAELDASKEKLRALSNVENQFIAIQSDLEIARKELNEARSENSDLRSEVTKIRELEKELNEKEAAVRELHSLRMKFTDVEAELNDLRSREKEFSQARDSDEIVTLRDTIKNLNDQILVSEEKSRQLESSLLSLENETKERMLLNESTFENEKRKLTITLDEKVQENQMLKDMNDKLTMEIVETRNKFESTVESNKENATMAKETIESLSHLIKEKDNEIETLKMSNQSNDLLVIQNERDELVKLVQVKHNESLRYHGEIQRLTRLLNDQASQLNNLITEQQKMNVLLKEKDTELVEARMELQSLQQRLENLKTANERGEVCKITEHSNQAQEIAVLNDKCNAMEAALIQEQSNNRMLQNQLVESQNKETNAAKELERLRTHLVEIESSYTEEALIAEEMRKDLEAKLAQAEEKLKNSSTVYTSASIRANQQVETLQQQMALIIQQRDDIQNKLSMAEDKVLSQTAALTNLQIVLEQFQRDKERDMKKSTEKLQLQIQESHKKQDELSNEILHLKEQLAEAQEYLQAASRLSEQLDKKTERIEQLNQEVERLTGLVNTADRRIEEAKQSGVGKVDKSLMKNLLLGYLSSSAADKSSVLRVFATVLDFTEHERNKTGLNNASSHNSWFSRLSGGDGTPTKDQEASLSAAFVRFLESESKPKPQLPALPISSSSSPRPTHSRQHSTSSTHSTLLLSNVTLPTFPDFVPARNTGSILKEVLKDS